MSKRFDICLLLTGFANQNRTTNIQNLKLLQTMQETRYSSLPSSFARTIPTAASLMAQWIVRVESRDNERHQSLQPADVQFEDEHLNSTVFDTGEQGLFV
jgi:hypothetical protein